MARTAGCDRGVPPGRYGIWLGRLQSLYIKSVRWGTTDVTDGALDLLLGVPARTKLAIMLGADSGELTGSVANEKSEPVDSATVTWVPLGGARRSRTYYKTATTTADGHFTTGGIAPGSGTRSIQTPPCMTPSFSAHTKLRVRTSKSNPRASMFQISN